MLLVVFLNLLVAGDSLNPSFMGLSTSMFVNSYESDFIYLRYSPQTTFPGATHPGGVFVTDDFKPEDIICQPRGHLVPMENISKVNISTILTYWLSMHDASSKKHFVLIDNTICSRIRFCFPTISGDGAFGSCGNAALSRSASGLVFVKAIKDIPYGTEIVAELRRYFILDPDSFQEKCQFDPDGCGVPIDGPSPKMIGVAPSVNFTLYVAPSTIPGAGLGLFTKYDISPYQYIALCQGKVYDLYDHTDAERGDRLMNFYPTSHGDVTIQGDNYCGYANDIIDIQFLDNASFSFQDKIPTINGLSTNSEQCCKENHISALVSNKMIEANSEIFLSYGDAYWLGTYISRNLS